MPITIVDYNPEWPAQFRELRDALAAALGDAAIAIEHVGSTAVPGLAAKPILDVDIVIESLERLPVIVERLASIGYTHQGDLGIKDRHAFKSPPGGPDRHVYACPVDAIALREHLAFRDYLRQNPGEADAYAKLKRDLAAALGEDRAAYTDQKTAFVRGVLLRCADSMRERQHKRGQTTDGDSRT